MQAIQFDKYGSADALYLADVPRPEPGPREVLMRVGAASVNPADANLRSGRFRLFLRLELPFILGSDVAGVVAAVGGEVTAFRPGDAIFAMIDFRKGGGYAEYVAVDEKVVAPMPPALSPVAAAGVPLAGLTALQAFERTQAVGDGASVLIYGASGGVGTLAVQIAKARGASVTGVCSAHNLDLVRSLGADAVIDYTSDAWSTYAEQHDVVLDAAAALPLGQGVRLTRRGGVVVSLNPGAANPINQGRARLQGRRIQAGMVKPDGAGLRQLAAWLADGTLHPCVDRVYPLERAAEAHRYVETKRARGKVVLAVEDYVS